MFNEPELLVYAASVEITRSRPTSADTWKKVLNNFFNYAGMQFGQREGAVIGHIKGFFKFSEEGYGYFSTLGTAQGTSCRWEAEGEQSHGWLDFNVLVYGWGKKDADLVVENLIYQLSEELGATCFKRDLGKK